MLDKSSEAGQVMETYLGMDEKMQQDYSLPIRKMKDCLNLRNKI